MAGQRLQVTRVETGERHLQLIARLAVHAHARRGAQAEEAVSKVLYESLDVGQRRRRVLVALINVDVLAVDEPFEDLLAGLGRLIVGGYLPRQVAIFVQRARLNGRFEYPRNLCAHDLYPS